MGIRHRVVGVVALLATAMNAYAADKACVELKTSAEAELRSSSRGRRSSGSRPPAKSCRATRSSGRSPRTTSAKRPTDNVVIANPVPEHMTYVAGSAMGTGTDIAYSLDGKEFKRAAELQVRAADGTTRAARADEYRAIRWTYKNAFAPGATAFVRYRALVK